MADWIVVVDDDATNLKMAGHILSKHNKRVTAMKSGYALLDYIRENVPDIILLDIKMPDMDGFETLKKLRSLEKELGINEIPVIFLTADDDVTTEMRGFESGVSDYVRKPFDPEILVKRIDNILGKQEKLLRFQEEATLDRMTGLLNKTATKDKMVAVCNRVSGYMMIIDLDSFKLVNDLYGHSEGDEVLQCFSKMLQENITGDSVIGRIGGDEFLAFSSEIKSEEDLKKLSDELNIGLVENVKRILGDDMTIPIGASIGAVYLTGRNSEYEECFKNADKALYNVKKNGKHGFSVYSASGDEKEEEETNNLRNISMILAERNVPNCALQLDKDSFIAVYRFLIRYILRYKKNACKLLFTLTRLGGQDDTTFDENCEAFCKFVKEHLRKSDLIMQYRKDQIFVFLSDTKESSIPKIINNIVEKWSVAYPERISATFEYELVRPQSQTEKKSGQAWVVVVDDDTANLKLAGHILSKNNIRVTALKSGATLLDFLKENKPDMVLLDIKMPGMDGFATKEKMSQDANMADIPVVFLTADENEESEKRGKELGAVDFIKKPFIPEDLVSRVRAVIK